MQTITTFDNTAEGWERSLCAFLAEKDGAGGLRRRMVSRRRCAGGWRRRRAWSR